jgi:hypothetical protein
MESQSEVATVATPRNPLIEAGEWLGWWTYLMVVGGGRPYLPALFPGPRALEDDPAPSIGEGSAPDRVPVPSAAPRYNSRPPHADRAA